jgi:hypothetical protein
MSAHAYWRINITANNGDATYTDIGELQLRVQHGEMEYHTGGTALSNGSFYTGPASAFDLSVSSSCILVNLPNYCGYHFASPREVVEIAINATLVGEATRGPKDFTLDYSDDGSTWTTLYTITNQTSWGTAEWRTFPLDAWTLAGNITEALDITDWRVIATRCANGMVSGTDDTTGTTYSITCDSPDPCIITLYQRYDYVWSAGKVVALNDLCVPTDTETTHKLYKATNIGSSPNKTHATTEPTWPASSTVVDNDITWTFVADLVDPISLGPKTPS